MVKEEKLFLVDKNMKVNGGMGKLMEKVNSFILVEVNTLKSNF